MTTCKGIFTAGVTALVLSSTAGCGGQDAVPESPSPAAPTTQSAADETASSPTAGTSDVAASVVRGMTEYDYQPAPSLTALTRQEPSVTVGEVVGWSDGRSLVESDGSGYVDTSYFAVLEVEVSKSYRAVAGQDGNGRIYVEVSRGGEIRVDGELPEGTVPVKSTIAELNEAVPAGTRVIVVGREAPTAVELESHSSDATVLNPAAGRPEGVSLLSPHVQGLIFEKETGEIVSGMAGHVDEWGWLPRNLPVREGFNQLVAELDALDK